MVKDKLQFQKVTEKLNSGSIRHLFPSPRSEILDGSGFCIERTVSSLLVFYDLTIH